MIHFTKIGNNTYAYELLVGALNIPEEDITRAEVVYYETRMFRVKFLDDYNIHALQQIPEDSDHYHKVQQLLHS